MNTYQTKAQTMPRRPVSPNVGAMAKHEHIIKEIAFATERKSFRLTLRENHVGKFLRLSEMNGRYQDNVIVPEGGILDLRNALDEMLAELNK